MNNWFTKEWWKRAGVWVLSVVGALAITFGMLWGLSEVISPLIPKARPLPPVPVKIVTQLTAGWPGGTFVPELLLDRPRRGG